MKITAKILEVSRNDDSLVVMIQLENTTDKEIRFLEWGTPFEQPLESNIFEIYRGNDKVRYVGIRCKRGEASDACYSTLPAGSTITIPFVINDEYDVYSEGEYKIRLNCYFTTKEEELIKVESDYFKFSEELNNLESTLNNYVKELENRNEDNNQTRD